jgi:hypothetical protein
VFNGVGSWIRNNTVNSGKGWGGIYCTGNSPDGRHLIEDNDVTTNSVIVNHYGIAVWSDDCIIQRNTIFCDPGQGLRADGYRNLVDSNNITLWSCEPDWDIDRFSLDGIRLNDYWNSYNGDSVISNNNIYVYGNNSPFFNPAEQKMVGITNVTSDGPTTYRNNRIFCYEIDSEVLVICLMPGSDDTGGNVLWENEHYESDRYIINWRAYASRSQDMTFRGCKFVKPLTASGSFQVISTHNEFFTSADLLTNTEFIDCEMEGGASLRAPDISSQIQSQSWEYTVKYTLTAKIAAPNRTEFLSGETVSIYDNTGTLIDTGVTDSNGEFTVGEQIDFICENREGDESSSSVSTSSSSISTSSQSSASSISTSSVSSSSISTSSLSSASSQSSSSSSSQTTTYRYIEYNPYKIVYKGITLLYTLDSTEYAWCYHKRESNLFKVV